MKILALLIVPILLFGTSYKEIIDAIEHSKKLQSARQMQQAAQKLYKSAKGKNYPTLDISISAYRLRETPTITFYHSGISQSAPMGTKSNFEGALSLTYPLFSGFAIESFIDATKLKSQKAKLEVQNLKRNLFLNVTKLAALVVSLSKSIEALQKAKTATQKAFKKAKALYENGLIPPSELYNIEAKTYQIEADITELRANKKQLLNTLSYITGTKIDSIELPTIKSAKLDKTALIDEALTSRSDIKTLRTILEIDKTKTRLAKSGYYPTIALKAELKRQGDTPRLSGNGYINADKSYIGIAAKWNLFGGFSELNSVEAAKLKELATQTKIEDYKEKVRQEIQNAFLELNALRLKLKSAQMETKAKEEYYKLTYGRFKNQLVSADELSRSIADLAAAKAKAVTIEADIFKQYQTLLLLGGTKRFLAQFQ